jgi:hypothetical protein
MSKKYWEIINDGVEICDTPKKMWDTACMYFKMCDDSPIQGFGVVKSGESAGTQFKEFKHRAYSIKGVCIYCGINEDYMRDVLAMGQIEGGDFYTVIERIIYCVQVQNFELAAAGLLQQQFMSKFILETEPPKRQLPVRVELVGNLPSLSSSESEILESIEVEYTTENPKS